MGARNAEEKFFDILEEVVRELVFKFLIKDKNKKTGFPKEYDDRQEVVRRRCAIKVASGDNLQSEKKRSLTGQKRSGGVRRIGYP